MQPLTNIQHYIHIQKQYIIQCAMELKASLLMENSLGSLSDPDSDSIHQMDVHRLDGLWNHLIRSASKLSNFTTSGIDGTVAFIDPLRQILDLFMEVVAAIQDEVVVIKLLWSLDRGIERRLFTPLIVVNAILPRRELTVENRVFFRSVFRFLLKLVFFLDYKNNRFVFSKTIEKSCLFYAPSSKGRSLYAYDLYPAVELIQVLLCREINLLPAYFTMHELNTKFRGDKSTRPHNLIEPEVERFMAEFDFPLRILYSYRTCITLSNLRIAIVG
uniref:Mediator of RNA polymerase II transcription subunit 23 n=2 Tax=Mesocestoides corti TaxID=53468 RepID=A0A5K3EQE0_MESCO